MFRESDRYSISDSTRGCYTISYNNYHNPVKYQFDSGRIYRQVGRLDDSNSIILPDSYGRNVDIVECGLQDYFVEFKIELDDLTQGCVDRLTKKGFEIKIAPINFTFDNEAKKITNMLYQVMLNNIKIQRNTWWGSGHCLTNDVYTGLMRAMSSFRRFGPEVASMQSCLKGTYLDYANDKKRLKMEAMTNIRR